MLPLSLGRKLASVFSRWPLLYPTYAERSVVILHNIAFVNHAHWLTVPWKYLEALYSEGKGDPIQAGWVTCDKQVDVGMMVLIITQRRRPSQWAISEASSIFCVHSLPYALPAATVDPGPTAEKKFWLSNEVECKLTKPASWYPAFLLWPWRWMAKFMSLKPWRYLLSRVVSPFYLFTLRCRDRIL